MVASTLVIRPGTGKTLVLSWIRKLFEEKLKWEHGKGFIYVAFQNKMAAMIGGFTLHAAADLAQSEDAGDRSVAGADIGNLHDRNQYLRWIWVDELSMLGTVLFARFEEKYDLPLSRTLRSTNDEIDPCVHLAV